MEDLTARDIMTQEPLTVSPGMSLREVAELLVRHRISGVPVVEADGTVAGILTEADLIDEEKRRVKLPRMALFGVYLVPEAVIRDAVDEGNSLTARDLMTRKVFTLPEDAPAREVAEEMVARKVNRIPITRDGKLIGIVTRADALRAITAHWRRT
jgi:CBS domain-containing protein